MCKVGMLSAKNNKFLVVCNIRELQIFFIIYLWCGVWPTSFNPVCLSYAASLIAHTNNWCNMCYPNYSTDKLVSLLNIIRCDNMPDLTAHVN